MRERRRPQACGKPSAEYGGHISGGSLLPGYDGGKLGPVQPRFHALLRVHILQLVGRRVRRGFAGPERDVALRGQGSASHVICHRVGVPRNVPVGDGSAESPLGPPYFLYRPIDGMPLRSFVDPQHKADQQLAVAEDPDWQSEVGARG